MYFVEIGEVACITKQQYFHNGTVAVSKGAEGYKNRGREMVTSGSLQKHNTGSISEYFSPQKSHT